MTLPAAVDLPSAVRDIKANSSRWAHQTFPTMGEFAWQGGYSAFSVSRSMIPTVADYIAHQAERHRAMTFEEELVGLLQKHGIEYSPRHMWD